MEYRSANAGQHIGNDIVAGVNSSHGVQLSGGSTGGLVQAVGDDTDITLTLKGKGAGGVQIGNSTAPSFLGFGKFTDTAGAMPAVFNDTTCGRVGETTHVLTGVNSSHFVLAYSANLPANVSLDMVWPGSTAGDVHCRFTKGSTIAVNGTTCTINFLAFKF